MRTINKIYSILDLLVTSGKTLSREWSECGMFSQSVVEVHNGMHLIKSWMTTTREEGIKGGIPNVDKSLE